MEKAEKKISYEDNVKRLEEILDKMESNDTPLEQNLKLYEEGMKIIKLCQTDGLCLLAWPIGLPGLPAWPACLAVFLHSFSSF